MAQPFSIKPIRSSGLGDQLGTQFLRLYRLGVACGMEYVYDEIYFPRCIKPRWYDRIQSLNLNIRLALLKCTKGRKSRLASGVNAILMKIESRMDRKLLQRKDDLAEFLNIPTIAKVKRNGSFVDIDIEQFISQNPNFSVKQLYEFISSHCPGADTIPRLCWGAGVWAMIPSIDKALDGIDIPSPFAEAFAQKHCTGNDTAAKIVFHIRCGDSSTVFLPSGQKLIVYDKYLYTSEEQMAQIFAIDSHRKTILPDEYLKAFNSVSANNVTVISDGFDLTYRNILRNILKWRCPFTLTKEDSLSLIAQTKSRNDVFRKFKGARLLVGENEQLLKESILAISGAETLVWGVGGFAMSIKELFATQGYVCRNIHDC